MTKEGFKIRNFIDGLSILTITEYCKNCEEYHTAELVVTRDWDRRCKISNTFFEIKDKLNNSRTYYLVTSFEEFKARFN